VVPAVDFTFNRIVQIWSVRDTACEGRYVCGLVSLQISE